MWSLDAVIVLGDDTVVELKSAKEVLLALDSSENSFNGNGFSSVKDSKTLQRYHIRTCRVHRTTTRYAIRGV